MSEIQTDTKVNWLVDYKDRLRAPELRVFDNPFCRMVDFGPIPPDRIFITHSPTPVEEQDHPDLVRVKDEVMSRKQEEQRKRAVENGTVPTPLWDGSLPRVEQLIAIP